MVDDMCFIRSMHTEAINHEPAITYMQTGNQVTGRPCLGAWASYGLGSLNQQPADLRRPGRQADQHRAGAGHLRPACGRPATCPASMPASPSAPPAIRSSTSTIRPACRPTFAARRSTACKALNEMNYRAVGDPGDAHAHSAVRDGLPHAGQRAGVDRPGARAGVDVQALRRRRQEAGHVRQHGAAGAAHGRARRALRADLSQQLGHARQRRRSAARSVPRRRSGVLRTRFRI